MTWTRLDDGFPTHPKVIGLSDAGFRALVTGLCYANQHLTDGFIPQGVVKTRAAVELCSRKIWGVDNRGGYVIHDFLDYNRSKAEVMNEREMKREAGRLGGWRSGQARNEANAKHVLQADAKHGASEVLNPRPVPSRPGLTQTQTAKTEQPKQLLAATPRERDPIWDVLVDCYGQPTDAARGQWNAAAKVLRDYPAVADDIRAMIVALEGTDVRWAVVTPSALAKHFGQRHVLEGQVHRHGNGSRSQQLADELRAEGQ